MQKMGSFGLRFLTFGLAGCLLAGLVGCNSTSAPDERSSGVRNLDRQNRIAQPNHYNGDVIYHGNYRMQDRDELMGRNANPNLVVGHQDVQNNGIDTKNMQMMAKSVPGVENARITVNGDNAFVTLDLIPNVTAGQARHIEHQVIQALSQKIPRYDFHITSNDGYHR